MNLLLNIIKNSSRLPEDSFNKFENLLTRKIFKKKHVIAKFGETPSEFYILESGITRSFFIDKKGKEYIRSLNTAVSLTGSFSGLILDKPSTISYDCLTECIVYTGNLRPLKSYWKQTYILTKCTTLLSNLFI